MAPQPQEVEKKGEGKEAPDGEEGEPTTLPAPQPAASRVASLM